MRVALSYSLFGDPGSFEFPWYCRGAYFNARMNRILYPDFTSNLYFSCEGYYGGLCEELCKLFQIDGYYMPKMDRCTSMLWRMRPICSQPHITHVICRDLDSVSTYREALCTYEWLNYGLPYHAINDNDAHGGLMGGLVAFRSEDFKRDTGYTSFEQMIKGQDLSKHGSDQNFMNKHILPKIKYWLMLHKLKGAGVESKVIKTEVPASGPIDKKLWTSDLISRYIGSAGVIDMELLRFFKSVDPNPKFDAFEKRYSDIFYWSR
jgi:hypothetical protein